MDIEKAFDRLWPPGLIVKLNQLHFPDCYVHLLHHFLQNRTFAVRCSPIPWRTLSVRCAHQACETELCKVMLRGGGPRMKKKKNEFAVRSSGATSESHPISAGVPQGSVLSPLLYATYTADLPIARSCTIATFADDTALFSANKSIRYATQAIQRQLQLLEKWSNTWENQGQPSQEPSNHHLKTSPPHSTTTPIESTAHPIRRYSQVPRTNVRQETHVPSQPKNVGQQSNTAHFSTVPPPPKSQPTLSNPPSRILHGSTITTILCFCCLVTRSKNAHQPSASSPEPGPKNHHQT